MIVNLGCRGQVCRNAENAAVCLSRSCNRCWACSNCIFTRPWSAASQFTASRSTSEYQSLQIRWHRFTRTHADSASTITRGFRRQRFNHIGGIVSSALRPFRALKLQLMNPLMAITWSSACRNDAATGRMSR